MTLKVINEKTNLPISTLQYICKRYFEEERLHDADKSGRPRVLKERSERFIVRKVKIDPKISAPKIAEALETDMNLRVSPETMQSAQE